MYITIFAIVSIAIVVTLTIVSGKVYSGEFITDEDADLVEESGYCSKCGAPI